MEQNLYFVVKSVFVNNKATGDFVLCAHYDKSQAENIVREEFKKLAGMEDTCFAELLEFSGVRGIVRDKVASCSIYVVKRRLDVINM